MDNWSFSLRDLVDIMLVAVGVYYVLRLMRGTRAVQMLMGLSVLVLLYELARFSGLLTVEWVFEHIFSSAIIILVVLFQQEVRRGLMRIGINPLSGGQHPQIELANALVDISFSLSRLHWGGLIVVERETGLKHLFESGVEMTAPLREDVINALFCPQAPMHDGAVIIQQGGSRGGHVAAARVLLPLAQASSLAGHFGTRHRAAIGVTEESDALVIVISEETSSIRLAEDGELSEVMDHAMLRSRLLHQLDKGQRQSPVVTQG